MDEREINILQCWVELDKCPTAETLESLKFITVEKDEDEIIGAENDY